MKEIRFAHVSDTHICKNYENTQIKDVYAGRENPTATLRRCLKKFEQDKLDFVLFTGDLVHEGKKEDYDYFLDTVRESMPNTKAIFVLGNHDRKQPFFESMGMEEREAYCYVEEIAGLRIVVLDSGVAGQETGRISETQEKWLEKILQENPTIEVVIDLHRDAVSGDRKLMMDLQGRPTARFMFFNGLSYIRKSGRIEYLENPYIQDNLAFSFQAQVAANEYYPGLVRKVYLKAYRYNLHLKPRSMLIELGAQNNTVEEIQNACDPLAHILAIVLDGML